MSKNKFDERLTNRQLEIAFLARSGLTSREIAEQLNIRKPTVESHLQRIYERLRITKRTELADTLGSPTYRSRATSYQQHGGSVRRALKTINTIISLLERLALQLKHPLKNKSKKSNIKPPSHDSHKKRYRVIKPRGRSRSSRKHRAPARWR